MPDIIVWQPRYTQPYSCDSNEWGQASHMKNRKFTTWIKRYKPQWRLYHQEAKAGYCTFYIYAPRF